MPLESTDPGYKTWLLQKQGYDPSQYNMDDDGNVSTKVIAQPNLPTNREPVPDDGPIAQTKPQTTSSTQAFLGHAASSIIPTFVGLGSGAISSEMLPFAHAAPPYSELIAGLVGGIAGGFGANKVQGALQSDETKQNLATEQQEHGAASKLGDLAPSALAFNPIEGIMEAPGIIRNIPKLLGANPNALTSAEIDGLKAAGLNVGIQSGINTAQQLSSDQPFNYEDLAADAASGLVLNSPWGVGKMLFPEHGNTVQVRPNTKPDANITSPVEPPPPIPVSAYGGVPPEQSDVTAQPTPGGNQRGNAMYYYKEGVDTEPQQIAMEGEGGPSISSDTGDADNLSGIPPENVRQTDFLRAQAEQEQQTRDSLALQRAKDIQSSLGASQATGEDSPLIQGTNPQRDNTRGMQADNEDVAAGSDLEERQAEGTVDKYQPETAPLDDSEKQQFGLFSQSDPRYIKAVSQLAVKRGISLQRANEILGVNEKGETFRARGAMNQDTRTATINPSIATEDTPLHEVSGHGYIDDLLASSIPADNKLGQRALNIFGDTATANKAADELLAQAHGEKLVGDLKTQTYGTKADQSKLWFRDFLSRWKNTLGVASDEDVMNHLSRRAITDAPRGTRGEIAENPIALNTAVKNQEESEPLPEGQDKGAAARLSELTNKGEALTPEEAVEKEALQKKSDSLEGKWKFQGEEEPFKLGSTKEERAPTKGDEYPLPFSSMPGFRSASDLILAKDGDRARPALAAAGKTLDEAAGKANDWIEQKNEAWKGISREDKNLMEAKGVQGVQEKRDTTNELPYHLQEPFKEVKDILRSQQQEAIDAKQPVKRGGSPSERRIDPNFWPQQYDPNAITLMKGKSAEGARLRKADTDYMVSKGLTKEQALERQNALLSPDTTAKPDMSHFRGLDVEQGIGVAPELQRPGADRNLERYFNRYAMGRSFHDNIESKPDIAPLFGIKKSPLGVGYDSKIEPLRSPEATALLSHLKGEDYHPGEGVLNASAKTAAAGILGPMIAAHIGLSSQFTMMTLAKPNELAGMVVAGTKNIGKAVKEAYSRGLLRYKPELLRDLLDAHSNAAERISSLGDLVSKVNGREDVVKYSSAMLLNQAKYLVDSRIPQAAMGDKQSIRMLQQLDPTWNSGKTYSEDEKGALAANLVRTIHGHDFRSLPPWMLSDNIIHPFVSLMSWNVSQTNSFFKHTVSAAREGNFTPLIMSTLGAGLGGYIIKEAREKLANKQSPIPTLSELAASSKGLEGNKPLIAYNLAAMASYAGYAGILSTAARDIFDVMYKNPAQGSIFPLDEILSNSMKTVSQAASAIANSNGIDNYIDIGTRASADLLRENVQLARMITSWGDEKGIFGEYRQEKKELNTSEGDLRRFKMAEGMPVEDQGSIDESNPYFNMGRKNFQKEQDIGKAAGELPGLIEDAFKSSNGNIEVLRSKLSALKRESYPSMPSPENAPITFYKYVNFLNKTQGPEIAAKRVQDYFIHNAINKAKSSMVPSI